MDLEQILQQVKGAIDQLLASLTVLNTLAGRVQRLEQLLQGVERVVSSDGIPGLYFPMRVGIGSPYMLHQVLGDGASLTVDTGTDKVAMLIQHSGSEGLDGLGKRAPSERTALKILNTDPHVDGKGFNVGIVVETSNAPTNRAIQEFVEYSVADPKGVTYEERTEIKNS